MIILVLIIAFHSWLLTKLNLFPYPELFVYPYLAENGLLPYKQIFDQHFPSLLMTPFNFYDLGLRNPESARLFLIGSVVITHLILFLISRKLLTNFIYLIVQPLFEGYILWLDTFLAPILLLAFYFSQKIVHEKKDEYAIFTGLFLGLALFFKQVMFPLYIAVGIYIFYKTRSLRNTAIYFITGAIPLLLTILWIFSKSLLPDFWYWAVQFNFEVYSKLGRKLPTFTQLARVVVFFLPAFYVVLARFKKEKDFLLSGIFLVFSLFTAVSRFEFVHLQPALPFVALLTAYFIISKLKYRVATLAIITITTIVWLPVFYKKSVGNRIYFFEPETIKTAQVVNSLTFKTDSIFILGAQPVIYPLSDRLPSGKVFSVNLPWNMKVAEDKILQGLDKDKPKIIVRDPSATIDGKKVTDFTQKIDMFIDSKYIKQGEIGNNEILIYTRDN